MYHLTSLLLLLSQTALAGNGVPAECKNVSAYQQALYQQKLQTLSVSSTRLKQCADSVAALLAASTQLSSAKQSAGTLASARGDGGQATSLTDIAAVAGSGAQSKESVAQTADAAKLKANDLVTSLGKQIKQVDQEKATVPASGALATDEQAGQFQNVNALARKDLVDLQTAAGKLATDAGQAATDLRAGAARLTAYDMVNRGAARNLAGGDTPSDVTGGDDVKDGAVSTGTSTSTQPAAKSGGGVSTGEVVALGGAAVIAAGVVGGLYWVTQKAVSSANSDATGLILKAQNAANNVVANAGSTATAIITDAQNAATNVLQFAFNSANQVIANGTAAAQLIYSEAQSDFAGLLAEMQSEVQKTFSSLTNAGLQELNNELEQMFQGLIAKAQAAGNATLAANLQTILNSLTGQIQSEILSRQGAGAGTSTGTGTDTATATGTSTSTSTVSATEISTGATLINPASLLKK